ncbi:MAG: 16S rRNA (adenine(1518)-N(6)/adenine(1519)-N(6))-dimethyltransferase RsmA [Clostridia bacterium]|jgi:16S rRNA (adenine1518-N6/adenine1519-N6)-dimethyltransferase|nr:16S rRNA (adenine(1518)-N(6)/adenine(1519)-N(6))-dimethyltransferase RsmA [Clostridia bacterium]
MSINITSPKVARELMSSYGIAPLKKFGQNFLVDGNIADKIANAALPQDAGNAAVIEVGPGLGGLTQRLTTRAAQVAAYEIDAGLVRSLKDTFEGVENFSLFHQDFLKADLEKELTPIFGEADIYVAANLPYYITSPCIMKLVESGLNIKRITVMIQKEVAQRICAMPGSKEYGSISAAIGFFADAKMLFSVSPSCFYPKPDVYSAVLSIEMKQYDAEKAEQYSKTVRGLFAKRRKTVRSNLRQSFELTIGQANAIIQKAQIDENARAETLNVNDFARISEEIVNIQKNIEN